MSLTILRLWELWARPLWRLADNVTTRIGKARSAWENKDDIRQS